MRNEPKFADAGKAIALVDDDADMRSVLEDFLTSTGYEVHSYSSAQEFIQMLEQARRSFSLIISDVHMPGTSGLDMLERIREIRTNIPVLLMTADPNFTDEVAARGLGVGAYLSKPFSLKELHYRIRSHLA